MITRKIILGSNSPRRKQILQDCGFVFTCLSPDIDESFSDTLIKEEVPMFLAKAKAEKILASCVLNEEIVITADTIVHLNGTILNKPDNEQQAYNMLRALSNKKHQVITGFAITDGKKMIVKSDTTDVQFKELSEDEIKFYINQHKPFDKAGAYGVQEFIGMIGIVEITGSFYNVMGLPIHKVYEELLNF